MGVEDERVTISYLHFLNNVLVMFANVSFINHQPL